MISPRSPLAMLFASLIVSASADAMLLTRSLPSNVIYLSTKLRPAVRQSWISAINNDDVESLLSLASEYNPGSLRLVTTSNGKSALMVAAKKGHQRLAELMIESGANVNEATETQGTPFMFAVLGGHRNMAQWLLDQGADLNTVGSNGWTALTIAAAKGNVPVLQWLIGEGADTQVRDVYRFTPFLRAVDNEHLEAVEVLLSLVETDVNARDEMDNTALHFAVSAGNEAMVRLLLLHHADPHLVNRNGISPMTLASRLSDESQSIVRALTRAGQH